ncbi:MAG: hypothetical protein ACI8RD_008058 [Bacillariaceae sp.]|jgi:hypothetical protein
MLCYAAKSIKGETMHSAWEIYRKLEKDEGF